MHSFQNIHQLIPQTSTISRYIPKHSSTFKHTTKHSITLKSFPATLSTYIQSPPQYYMISPNRPAIFLHGLPLFAKFEKIPYITTHPTTSCHIPTNSTTIRHIPAYFITFLDIPCRNTLKFDSNLKFVLSHGNSYASL